ncbi:MAG: cytochrome c oxidase subunit 2 [bacterium]|jgi:cytochrome c oxidase subunit 2
MLNYFLESASSYGGDIDKLFDLITYLVGFWFILVQGVFLYLIFRFRRKTGVKAKYIEGNTKKQLAWVFIPLFLIIACDIVIDISTHTVWAKIKQTTPPPYIKVRVIARQWLWQFQYPGKDGLLDTADDFMTESTMWVPKNKVVQFELESKDVLHSFSIPSFRVKQDVIPGRRITGWFKAIKARKGGYDIQCAEMCGVGHGLMPAKVIVYSVEQFNRWEKKKSFEKLKSLQELNKKKM